MKRKWMVLLAIAVSIVFFSACAKEKEEDPMIQYESGIYFNKNWSEDVGTYSGAAIPDQETALEVAKAIFNGMDKSKATQEVPQSVFYDEEDEFWIVSFGIDSDEFILGGDCSIALQKRRRKGIANLVR